MNTLIDFFKDNKDSFVLKVFTGIIALVFSLAGESNQNNEVQKQKELTPVDIAFQQKFMEVDNAYFNAYIKTIK
jgi:hypothetical protein